MSKAPREWQTLREVDRNHRQTKPVGRINPANRIPAKLRALQASHCQSKKRPITLPTMPWSDK